MAEEYILVSEENAGERLDKLISNEIPELSRSAVQKLINDSLVFVNSTVLIY